MKKGEADHKGVHGPLSSPALTKPSLSVRLRVGRRNGPVSGLIWPVCLRTLLAKEPGGLSNCRSFLGNEVKIEIADKAVGEGGAFSLMVSSTLAAAFTLRCANPWPSPWLSSL